MLDNESTPPMAATESPAAAAPDLTPPPQASPWGQPAWVTPGPPPAARTPFNPFGAPPPWATPTAVPSSPPRAQSRALGLAPLYDLRPLSTGEILDRTFSLYRKRFWLFAGMSSVAAAVITLGTFIRLIWNPALSQLAGLGPGRMPGVLPPQQLLISYAITLVEDVFYFILYSLMNAAIVAAVSDVYLGHETSAGKAFRATRGHWVRYLLIALWQGWSLIWLPSLLFTLALFAIGFAAAAGTRGGGSSGYIVGGLLAIFAGLSIFYGVYAYMRNSLAIIASVIEGLNVRLAMRRSKALTHHRMLRVLALLLLLFVLTMAASIAQGIPAALMLFGLMKKQEMLKYSMEGLTLLATFITGSLLAPVGAIAYTLFYIDERVRREGFDIEALLGRADDAFPPGLTSSAATQELASPFSSSGLV